MTGNNSVWTCWVPVLSCKWVAHILVLDDLSLLHWRWPGSSVVAHDIPCKWYHQTGIISTSIWSYTLLRLVFWSPTNTHNAMWRWWRGSLSLLPFLDKWASESIFIQSALVGIWTEAEEGMWSISNAFSIPSSTFVTCSPLHPPFGYWQFIIQVINPDVMWGICHVHFQQNMRDK